MANELLGQLGGLIAPQLLDQVSKQTGVDTGLLNKGISAAGAATLGSMANTASSGDGLSSLMDMVGKVGNASGGGNDALGSLAGSLLGGGGSGGNALGSLAGSLLGGGGSGGNALGSLAGSVLGGGGSGGGGADALGNLLGSIAGGGSSSGMGSLLGPLMGSVLGGGGGAAGALTNTLLGGGGNAVSGSLSKSLGFNVGPLMAMIAPMMLGLITKATKGGNLDANGLKSMVTDQSTAFMNDPANAGIAKVVSSALDAGKAGAANQAKYTPEGLTAIKAAPLAAAAMVAASTGAKGGAAATELGAAASAISKVAGGADPSSLMNMVFGSGVSMDDMDSILSNIDKFDPATVIKNGLGQVSQGNPAELASYKSMILNAATAAAESKKEGGFLGIGGQQVSAGETAVLDQLRSLLG